MSEEISFGGHTYSARLVWGVNGQRVIIATRFIGDNDTTGYDDKLTLATEDARQLYLALGRLLKDLYPMTVKTE